MFGDKEGKIFVLPWQNSQNKYLDIVCLDLESGEISHTDIMKSIYKQMPSNIKYWDSEIVYACVIGGRFIKFLSGRTLKWYEFDMETGEKKEFELKIDLAYKKNKKIIESYYNERINLKRPIPEEEMGLEWFVESMVSKDV